VIIEKLEPIPFAANTYVVGDETKKEGMIIDPGADALNILKKADNLRIKIKFIVLTHRHGDHLGALKQAKEGTRAEVAIHAYDAEYFKSGVQFAMISRLTLQIPPSIDRLLKDGDRLDIGDLHFTVLHTPGHTAGGICLLGDGVIFTGDTLFNFGIGRYDLPGGDGYQLMHSIHKKLMVLPDNTTVYPGHGPETTIGTERLGNPFLI